MSGLLPPIRHGRDPCPQGPSIWLGREGPRTFKKKSHTHSVTNEDIAGELLETTSVFSVVSKGGQGHVRGLLEVSRGGPLRKRVLVWEGTLAISQ